MTFDEFMRAINAEIEAVTGLSVYDLPDFPFMDWYDDECDPSECAFEILEDQGYSFEQ